jgi:hypothetical protein
MGGPPPAIHPYREYISYLEDVVIFNLRKELVSVLASPDLTSTNDDDGPVTEPMVVKTNTDCEDEYYCCSCHKKKNNIPPATPPSPPSDPTPPRRGTTCPPNTPAGLYVRVLWVLFVQLDYNCCNSLFKFSKAH